MTTTTRVKTMCDTGTCGHAEHRSEAEVQMMKREVDRWRSKAKGATEFDQVFEEMSAPEYPATCDNCGEVGTNATMAEHGCVAMTPCAECGGVSGERYQRHKTSCSFVEEALVYNPQLQPHPEQALSDQTTSDFTNWRVEYVAPTKPEHDFEPSCAILAD